MRFLILFCTLLLGLLMVEEVWAQPKWLRATYRDDPATTICIGWSGLVATLYYDTVDHGRDYNLYAQSHPADRSTSHKGNNHYFARLGNLQPGTVYYLVLRYNANDSTERYSFRTLSDDPNDPISFISGGDSRKRLSFLGIGDPNCWGNGCRETRQDLNTIVGRIRPDFVAFTGDYIRNYDIPFAADSEEDWKDWMDDWQLATGPDGRITPIIHSLGNHEDAVDLDRLFDVPNTDIYYATNFGGNLFRLYTLNSETNACTDVIQKNWFINDLQQNSTPSNTPYWKIVQYHQPMVPHANYSPRTDLINCWAAQFHEYGVRLACESHAHVLKTTYPLVYDTTNSASTYNNLVRNDQEGAVFLGDGSWGAPPRPVYAPIDSVTQDAATISGMFFININQQRIQIKSVVPYPDSMVNVPQLLDDDQGTLLPAGVPLWRPPNGSSCIIIPNTNPIYTNVSEVISSVERQAIIAPNPAQDYVTVRFKKMPKEPVTIEVYDARGKRCQVHNDINKRTVQLDVSNLCSGVNFINIVSKNDVESHKIIVTR